LRQALKSVDVQSKQAFGAAVERGDTCVVPAAGVIAEAMLGLVLAAAFVEKFGGDSIEEIQGNYSNFLKLLDKY
jgi:chorismate synthase